LYPQRCGSDARQWFQALAGVVIYALSMAHAEPGNKGRDGLQNAQVKLPMRLHPMCYRTSILKVQNKFANHFAAALQTKWQG
jgi:hypothetical protein